MHGSLSSDKQREAACVDFSSGLPAATDLPLRRDDADADADADNDIDDNADDGDCHIFPATPGQQSLTIKIKSQ